MSFKRSSLLSLALLLAFSSGIQAFDITKLLGQYPEFSLFNQYLTETKLADQINSQKAITVLAVDNAALSSISGKSKETIKAIISTHVALDYYDEKKLMIVQGSNEPVTTLYQTTGLAVNQQGFIKVALIGEGEIAFGSAVNGAPANAELVKTVTTQPDSISILQVSKPIVFPGIDAHAQTPVPAQGAKAPVPSTKPSPSGAETKTQGSALAQAPGVDAGAPAPAPSSSSRTKMGLVGAVMGFASLLIVF